MSLRVLPFTLLAASMCFAAPDGAALYKSHCAVCHDGAPQERMPSHAELAARAPEAVLNALTQGAMMTQAAGLSLDEERAIATFITGKEISASTQPMTGTCQAPAKKFSLGSGDWSGWGVDPTNSHYQPKPGLSASEVPKLKLKWAFGFPKDSEAFSQPAVAGGRIFVGSNAGNVYSLDAATGCIYWTYAAGAGVRTAISLGKLPSGKWVAYFGDLRGNAQAVDAETGALIWKVNLDKHPVARITGSPVLVNGRLYVPVASIEEALATRPTYQCCTFRGSLAALDAATGRKIWQTYTVPDPAKPYKKNKNGTPMLGPAGVAIWGAPTIDLKRKVVYASGGDSYTDVEVHTSDSIMAFDLETGRMLWASQVQTKDNFIVGCPNAANCPESDGPDFDFGTAPVLRKLPNGKEILIAGQKSGVVYGLDPDNQGKILWQTRLGKGSALGGVEWGHAADNKLAYVAISDRLDRDGTPGIYALDFATGKQKWGVPTPAVQVNIPDQTAEVNVTTAGAAGGSGRGRGRGRGRGARSAPRGQSAAVSVIPGVVFSGALDGHFRAYSASTGDIVWDFDTNRPFDTVNGVAAKGGSVDGPGAVIAHGMVFTNSGYGTFGGIPGNVLLAFSVDGK